ncbi:MAG TPA: lipopolysaccharide transport periplasmic protein LptA [Burkholderiaceae bacterium]|nr:lipopolysaccharide transport periplasmic protein LptA [Burkholderiaceae bacterium]HRP28608.1 lipopolysaccharide transport periplasmic protein LptA [Burkholderiaceae bacterium]
MSKAQRDPFASRWLGIALVLLACVLLDSPVRAEKADRDKPLNIEADSGRYDDLKQIGSFTGNVVVTKGTLTMRAAKIEIRQSPDGYQYGVATALPGQLATFSQKRDGVDETIRGEAERIEYDGKADTVRLVDRAVIRRYRGETLADETAGSLIAYDNRSEVFSVTGGPAAVTPSNPSGRVRATLAPREAASAPAASQPGAALRATPALGAAASGAGQ